MELKEIKHLLKIVSKYRISELNVKIGNIEVYIKKNIENHSINTETNPDLSLDNKSNYKVEVEKEEDKKLNYVIIKSPMIGTFYRRPSPDQDPYVKIGDKIEPGVKLCIIEAMKLFNDIESEITGKIIKILVEDTSPVEYDQPLFLIDPSQ